ncbi:MAG: penicillin-binding protein 1C [Blastochloris sp.]|nr:penicillin-binding protein 1C [Blastochloris sp.]
MRRILIRLAALLILGLGGGCMVLALWPKPDLGENLAFSQAYMDREGRLLRLTLARDGIYRVQVPLDNISPELIEATLLHEDRYFWYHPGVNPVALVKALLNECSGNPNRFGASTITMQLARISLGLKTRSFSGKLQQILHALHLDWHHSKEEILEAYLNQASYGRNIEGIGAASLVYYGKEPQSLNLAEVMTLAVIPQSPVQRTPRHADEPGGAAGNLELRQAREKLFQRWVREHPEDAGQENALAMALQVSTPRNLPFLAPHFVDWQRIRMGENPPAQIRSTLDLTLQQLCERQLQRFVQGRKDQGIRNAAALLVDLRGMEVRAAVGSANFFDDSIQGQVNGVTMRRSPGSTLKPLLYGLAMDQSLIHPHSLLKDAPISFAGYNPENYDRDYVGPLSASAALQQSRNVPAVSLAAELKKTSFHAWLQLAGVKGLKEESHYGLTLALGSAELSMVELAQLYGVLGNGGIYRELRSLMRGPEPMADVGQRVMQAESAFLVLDMLKQSPRPGRVRSEGLSGGGASVAWKTGTSWSYRDAWSVAVFDSYVLVVWVGNFDGQSNAALVGRRTAAPLLFQIIDAVRTQTSAPSTAAWEKREGLNLTTVDLCAVSGALLGKHCPQTMKGYFVPGVSPTESCRVHQLVWTDKKTGRRLREPGPEGTSKAEVMEVWPRDVQDLFRQAGIPRRAVPEYAQEDLRGHVAGSEAAPVILSPKAGVEYALGCEVERRQIALRANGSGRLRWFADARLLGESQNGEVLTWEPEPGTYWLMAVDDSGRSVAEEIKVVSAP